MKPMSIVRKNSQPPRRSPGFTMGTLPAGEQGFRPCRPPMPVAHYLGSVESVATRPLAIQKDGTWYCYGLDIIKSVMGLYGAHI